MKSNVELIEAVSRRLESDRAFAEKLSALVDSLCPVPDNTSALPHGFVAEAEALGFDVGDDGELWETGGMSCCIDTRALRRKHGL